MVSHSDTLRSQTSLTTCDSSCVSAYWLIGEEIDSNSVMAACFAALGM